MNNDEALFTPEDLQMIAAHGLSVEAVMAQLEIFRKGTPYVKLNRACTIGDGIVQIAEMEQGRLTEIFETARASGRITKFVPASGAASRMFKDLQSALNTRKAPSWPEVVEMARQGQAPWASVKKFIDHLPRFAFYEDLRAVFAKQGGALEEALHSGEYQKVLAALLLPEGLDYANLPKGLIKFHRYEGYSRTPFEEHLVEAKAYALDAAGRARIHFTIPTEPGLQRAVLQHLEEVRRRYETDRVRFEITCSVQKPSTDTIAVDLKNRPFRDEAGRLVFRPGGHGALLENLNDLAGDIVFIKNIDNVTPDDRKDDTIRYKKILGGYLVWLQQQVFQYLEMLTRGNVNRNEVVEIFQFVGKYFSDPVPPAVRAGSREQQREYLIARLNRPLRVCGIVKNQGEPGGGPFWVEDRHGNIIPQVVETAQIDTADPQQRAILENATHFSPTDFVCAVRDFRGRPFPLLQFRDPDSGFITRKSQNGRDLKALELPGLWNGGMAYWNSVFVEVPLSTFTPVKTVFALLRPEHQSR